MGKLTDGIDVFRYGKQVANPELWKEVGGKGSVVLGLAVDAALRLASDYGYNIKLTPEMHAWVIGATSYAVLFVVHVITTKKTGLLPAKDSEPASKISAADVAAAMASVAKLDADRMHPRTQTLGQDPLLGADDPSAPIAPILTA